MRFNIDEIAISNRIYCIVIKENFKQIKKRSEILKYIFEIEISNIIGVECKIKYITLMEMHQNSLAKGSYKRNKED